MTSCFSFPKRFISEQIHQNATNKCNFVSPKEMPWFLVLPPSQQKDQSMGRGCETECGSRNMQMLGNQRVEKAVLFPCTKTFISNSSKLQPRDHVAPKGFSRLLTLIAQSGSGSPSAQHVVCGFGLPFFFLNRLKDDAHKIPNGSRNEGSDVFFFGFVACK